MSTAPPIQPLPPRRSPLTLPEAAAFLQGYHAHLASLVETNRTRSVGYLGAIGGILWAVALLNFLYFVPLLCAVAFYLVSLAWLTVKRVQSYPPAFTWLALGDILLGAGIADGVAFLEVLAGVGIPQVSTYVLMMCAAVALWFPAWGFEASGLQVMTITPLALAMDRHSWGVASGDSKDVDQVMLNVMSVLEWYWFGNLHINRWLLIAFIGKEGRKELAKLSPDQQRDVLNDWMVRRHGNLSFFEYIAKYRATKLGGNP